MKFETILRGLLSFELSFKQWCGHLTYSPIGILIGVLLKSDGDLGSYLSFITLGGVFGVVFSRSPAQIAS